MECLATLIIAGLGVGVAIDGLHLPFSVLERHLFVLVLLEIHLLFALSLAGWRAFLVRLLLLFAELFPELLDLPALTRAMACRVMHRASGITVVATERLMGALVASFASASTYRRGYSYGGTSQRLVFAADLLLLLLLLLLLIIIIIIVVVVVVVVVVVTALSSGPRIGLGIIACL
jgi:hypothetical protein